MKQWAIDCGNSTRGPVGFVLRLRADTRDEALELARATLPEVLEAHSSCELLASDFGPDFAGSWPGRASIPVLLRVYFNSEHVTLEDIEEED
jgi:hypothetical protein